MGLKQSWQGHTVINHSKSQQFWWHLQMVNSISYATVCKVVVANMSIDSHNSPWTLTPLLAVNFKKVPSANSARHDSECTHMQWEWLSYHIRLRQSSAVVSAQGSNFEPHRVTTLSVWHLLSGNCLVHQSEVKVQRWAASELTIATTILQIPVHAIPITVVFIISASPIGQQ